MDLDPGGQKTYGSYESGFGYATLPQSVKFLTEPVKIFLQKCILWICRGPLILYGYIKPSRMCQCVPTAATLL
jgi:hypothetical protein